MQCYNCQYFGQVWGNCRHPLLCVCCGDGHHHGEWLEKDEYSVLRCCNCTLAEVGTPKSQVTAVKDMRKKNYSEERFRESPTAKNPSGRAFSSRYTTPVISFAAAVRRDQQPRLSERW
jgi:hypothetical protein